MQKLVLSFSVLTFLFFSCATTQESATGAGDTSTISGYTVKNTSDLTDLVNYVVIKRNGEFQDRFSTGAGAGEVDFSEDMVVAIVGLPSNKEMSFSVLKTERTGDVLNIHYDVNYTWKELPMNTAPALVMTVSKDRDYDRINFYSQNTLRKSIQL